MSVRANLSELRAGSDSRAAYLDLDGRRFQESK
jgi:hypothetical protein